MVVIAIIAIMSVSATVGIGVLKEVLAPRHAASFIQDLIKETEMALMREEYDEATAYLTGGRDYLVIAAKSRDAAFNLSWNNAAGCLTAPASGELKKESERGAAEMFSVEKAETVCPVFAGAGDMEWRYRLVSAGKVSPVVRYARFNTDRPSSIFLAAGTDAEIVMTGRHAIRRLYDHGNSVNKLTLTLTDNESNSSELEIP